MNADALTDAKRTACPASIHEPNVDLVLENLLLQKIGVSEWMVNHKRSAETGAEGHLWLNTQTDFSSGDLAGVSGDEMVDRLIRSQFRDRRHHAGSIAGKENDIFRMPRPLLRHAVFDIGERIGSPCVLSDCAVIQIQVSRNRIERYIFEHGTESACASVDLRLGLG